MSTDTPIRVRDDDIETAFTSEHAAATADADGTDGDATDAADGDAVDTTDGDAVDVTDGDATDADGEDV